MLLDAILNLCFSHNVYFKVFGGEQPNSSFQPMAYSHI